MEQGPSASYLLVKDFGGGSKITRNVLFIWLVITFNPVLLYLVFMLRGLKFSTTPFLIRLNVLEIKVCGISGLSEGEADEWM